MKLVLASQNPHKLTEMQEILSKLGVEIISQRELGISVETDESGTTFEENSYLKAKDVLAACGMASIADDSGLSVDALQGAPGVYSHRFGQKDTDEARRAYLLERMDSVPDGRRTARFVTVITCLLPDGRKIVARGECEGEILREERGTNGFGYDSLFYYPPLRKTFGELSAEEKNSVSHRSRALRAFSDQFREMLNDADK